MRRNKGRFFCLFKIQDTMMVLLSARIQDTVMAILSAQNRTQDGSSVPQKYSASAAGCFTAKR